MHALNKFVNKFVRPYTCFLLDFYSIFVESVHCRECTIDATVAHSACAIFECIRRLRETAAHCFAQPTMESLSDALSGRFRFGWIALLSRLILYKKNVYNNVRDDWSLQNVCLISWSLPPSVPYVHQWRFIWVLISGTVPERGYNYYRCISARLKI